MVALGESVYVEPVSAAYIHACRQYPFGPREVFGPGQLDILLLALDDGHVKPVSACDFYIIGGFARIGPVRGEDFGKAETLRRLRAEQPVPALHPRDAAVAAGPERIRHGKRRRRCGRFGKRRQNPINHGARYERARAIMDQHLSDSAAFQRFQRVSDRFRPRLPACDKCHPACEGLDPAIHVVGVKNDDDAADTSEGRDAALKNRQTREVPPLLRQTFASARSAPRRDDDDHGFSRLRQVELPFNPVYFDLVRGAMPQQRDAPYVTARFFGTSCLGPYRGWVLFALGWWGD